MAAPNTVTSEHPIGGGGSPSYLGAAGGNVGFYQDPYAGGAVPQRSNANQVALTVSAASGLLVTHYTLSQSVSTNVTLGWVSSVVVTYSGAPQVSTADLLIVNKQTPVPGLGICNAKWNAAGASPNFTNLNMTLHLVNASGVQLNTSSDQLATATFRGFVNSVTLSPVVVAANTTAEQQFTVTGIAPGMIVPITKPTDQPSLGMAGTRVVSNNVLGITWVNSGNTAITPTASEVYQYVALPGIASTVNIMRMGIYLSQGPTVLSCASTEGVTAQMVAVSGVQASDWMLGTGSHHANDQPGLTLISARVSAANVVALSLLASSSPGAASAGGVRSTPISGDTYVIPFLRPQAAAPMVMYNVALAPAVVGVSTTSDQAFTVTGLTVSSVVFVSKPSFTSGIGIVGYRVSATNILGLTFCNPTSASITPPTETYTIAQFGPMFGAGHYVEQVVSPLAVAGVALTNEMRNALAGTGFIGGS